MNSSDHHPLVRLLLHPVPLMVLSLLALAIVNIIEPHRIGYILPDDLVRLAASTLPSALTIYYALLAVSLAMVGTLGRRSKAWYKPIFFMLYITKLYGLLLLMSIRRDDVFSGALLPWLNASWSVPPILLGMPLFLPTLYLMLFADVYTIFTQVRSTLRSSAAPAV